MSRLCGCIYAFGTGFAGTKGKSAFSATSCFAPGFEVVFALWPILLSYSLTDVYDEGTQDGRSGWLCGVEGHV